MRVKMVYKKLKGKLQNIYFKEIAIGIILATFFVAIISNYYIIATIPSESMTNTLKVGDKVIIDKTIEKKDIKRGSIYTFYKDNKYMIKRCIALGGDHVIIKDNDVYINGKLLKEPYVSSKVQKDFFDLDFVVPKNKVLFLGDNRYGSYDARFWDDKFIDLKDVEGVATRIIFPFTRIKKL